MPHHYELNKDEFELVKAFRAKALSFDLKTDRFHQISRIEYTAANLRRLYLHVLHGGNVTADDLSGAIQSLEDLITEYHCAKGKNAEFWILS